PKPWSGRGRRPCNVQRDDEHKPVSVKGLALSLGKKAWRSVTWREGSNAPLASRFAAVRVHLAARDYKRTTPNPVEWLLVEWPKGEAAPSIFRSSDPASSWVKRPRESAISTRSDRISTLQSRVMSIALTVSGARPPRSSAS